MPQEKYSFVTEIFEHSPAHRRALRALRPDVLPDAGALHRLGRRAAALARHDEPRRRHEGPFRRHGARHDDPGQAARHPRHRRLRGPLVPHQPLGLRLHRRRHERRDDRPRRQAGGDHRHRRHGDPVRAPRRPGRRAPLRVPAHAVVGRLARQQADRPRVVVVAAARLAARAAGELRRDGRRPARRGRPHRRRVDEHLPQRRQLAEGREPAEDEGGAQPRRRARRLPADEPAPRARRGDRRRARTPPSR